MDQVLLLPKTLHLILLLMIIAFGWCLSATSLAPKALYLAVQFMSLALEAPYLAVQFIPPALEAPYLAVQFMSLALKVL